MQYRIRLILSLLLMALGVVTIVAVAKNRNEAVAVGATQKAPQTVTITPGQAIPTEKPASVAAPLSNSAAAATYEINWQSINGGGEDMQSAMFEIQSSIGQSAIGEATSSTYELKAGYWYGVDSDASSCACDCQGDENCDGQPNVFDVVFAVGEAFRNDPYTPDPNPLCPLVGLNDLNLDGQVNVFDIVFLVNMAFRNGLREDNVCDPCTLVGPPSCPF